MVVLFSLAAALLGLVALAAAVLLGLFILELLVTPTYPAPHPSGGILVTGASTGIGEDAALTLAKEGFLVFAGVRRAEDGTKLQAKQPGIVPVILDVTRQADIDTAVAFVTAELAARGGLPLVGLVNNAGVWLDAEPVELITPGNLRGTFDVNFFGLVATTKAFLPLLRQARGRVVNMSSMAGLMSLPAVTAYTCSKAATEAFSDILRLELLKHDVSVSVIEPTFIKSEILKKIDSPETAAAQARMHELYGHCFFKPQDQARIMAAADPPAVTSAAVLHALTAKRPKTRYPVSHLDGFPFPVVLWLLWTMSDRVKDVFMVCVMLKAPFWPKTKAGAQALAAPVAPTAPVARVGKGFKPDAKPVPAQ